MKILNLESPIQVDHNTITAQAIHNNTGKLYPVTLRRVLHNFEVWLEVSVNNVLVNEEKFHTDTISAWLELETRAHRAASIRLDLTRIAAVNALKDSGVL